MGRSAMNKQETLKKATVCAKWHAWQQNQSFLHHACSDASAWQQDLCLLQICRSKSEHSPPCCAGVGEGTSKGRAQQGA